MNILIDLQDMNCLENLIQMMQPLYASQDRQISIKINLKKYNDLTHLLCIVSLVKSLQKKGKDVIIECRNDIGYLQRINFFKELGVDSEEFFQRHNASGRFLEVSHITKENALDTVNKIIKILEEQTESSTGVIECLSFCLWEVVDNIDIHAKSPIGGYTVAQYYPQKKFIEIIIVDTGRGIHSSLTKNPEYKDLSEEEAISKSIEQETTSGDGRGNGLYYTVEYIKENNGEFILYSGNYKLELKNGNMRTKGGPHWQGTLICIKINTDIPINMNNIFGAEIPTSIEEFDDFF